MMNMSANRFCIHPQNYLRESQSHDPLHHKPSNCGACECPIAGKMYNCTACNSDLHPFCKSCPQNLTCPLHPHPLTLLHRDFSHALIRLCAVCGEHINGVSYACSPCNFDVHPQCSQLPPLFPCPAPPGTRKHSLELQLGDGFYNGASCSECGGPCGKWAYRCRVCSVSIHYVCLSMKLTAAAAAASRGLDNTTHRGVYGHHDHHYGNGGAGPLVPQQFGHGHHHNYPQGYGMAPYYYNYHINRGFHHQGFPWVGYQINIHNIYNYNCNCNNNCTGGGTTSTASGTGGGTGGKVGRIVCKIAGSLAVNLLCSMVGLLFN